MHFGCHFIKESDKSLLLLRFLRYALSTQEVTLLSCTLFKLLIVKLCAQATDCTLFKLLLLIVIHLAYLKLFKASSVDV